MAEQDNGKNGVTTRDEYSTTIGWILAIVLILVGLWALLKEDPLSYLAILFIAALVGVFPVIYLAYRDGQIAGQVRLCRYWNRYAYIEDLVVDASARREGIGQALMREAMAWAKTRGFPGIMLETQNNNVAACNLYERCGLTLAGFDTCLYRGIDPENEEIALYWYLLF